ncbi:hypothetical protein [Streptomyces sp. NPDC012510]|uniref:hypothetical protein n=1 Tax=Streptomyces sp. NPDC012510 TaxID=3364838 RepID=UPI0036E2906B
MAALKPHRGTWARADQPHTAIEAAHALTWLDARRPGDWTAVERHFRDGHSETWWAADARLGGYGPDSPCRLVVATTDPARLPEKATWYLATNLSHPDAPHAATSPDPPADLAEIVRLYGLRPWIEQSYKQIKDELGWADFQVRSTAPSAATRPWSTAPSPSAGTSGSPHPDPWMTQFRTGAPTRGQREGDQPNPTHPNWLLAQGITFGPRLAHPCHHPEPMVAILDGQRPTSRTPGPDRRGHHRTRH